MDDRNEPLARPLAKRVAVAALTVWLPTLAACAAQTPEGTGTSRSASSNRAVASNAPPSKRLCVARPQSQVPQHLSQLGCFDGDDPRWLSPEVIAFDVNAPLWTDGAQKERFFSLPDGVHIALDEHGDFVLPAGALLGKTFALGETRIETRVLMNDSVEGWHGYSYRWNEAGTDAELAPEQGEELHGVGPNAQDWTIPARQACNQCHTAETHVSLGLEVAQLNRDFTDPRTGESFDQLDRLIERGLVDGNHPTLASRDARPKLADYHDESQPTDARARAYLHANCGSCHTSPENFCSGDLRFTASDAQMGVCNAEPKVLDPRFGWPDGVHLLTPGDPERSVIVQRLRAPGGSPTAMPPIGRHGVDEQGVALVTQWIAQMQGCVR